MFKKRRLEQWPALSCRIDKKSIGSEFFHGKITSDGKRAVFRQTGKPKIKEGPDEAPFLIGRLSGTQDCRNFPTIHFFKDKRNQIK
ncbi:MAG: hypothetical protein WBI10_12175 [Syntrophales bacterium]